MFNNTNVSFVNKNRNLIVFGIILVFLIIIGIIMYKGSFTNIDTNLNLKMPPIFSEYSENDIANDPGNVDLLNNIKNRTVKHEIENKEQVYNISNNIFSYKDARAACKAHGGDLANYEQVLDSYKKGGDWCNYGWSDGQMALYPTQKDTWEELQKDPESSGTCGNWGVNGGYFDNPDTLFGANCYGMKPKPKDREKEKKLAFTNNQKIMLDKVRMYKNQSKEMTVLPFNQNVWSEKGKHD